jgi:hypothetical protein
MAVVHLGDFAEWLNTAANSLPPTRGATALAVRQSGRLRPWVALAQHHRVDPTALSRLAVWVDTDRKEPWLLDSAARRLSELIPAYVDGASLGRGVRWADTHLDDLIEFEHRTRAAWRSARTAADEAVELAEKGRKRESQLAAAIAEPSG